MDLQALQDSAKAKASKLGFSVGANQQGFGEWIGPFFEGQQQYALFIDERHLNPEGFVHGGVLASAMDYVLYRVVGEAVEHELATPTVDLQLQYLGAVHQDACVLGQGLVLRETRSLLFVRGELLVNDEIVLAATAVYKKVKSKS